MKLVPAAMALFVALPSACYAQLTATVGPAGEVTGVSVDGVRYLSALALSVARPGWGGTIVDQRSPELDSVRVAEADGVTTYTSTLVGGEARFAFRETVRVTPEELRLECDVTPDREVLAEKVFLHGVIPADVHAGRTRYVMADPGLPAGLLPGTLDPSTHLIVGGRAADWVGLVGPVDSAIRIIPDDLVAQLQDDRKWDVPGFGLLLMSDARRLLPNVPVRLAVSIRADTREGMARAVADFARGDLTRLKLSDDRPLAIANVRVDRSDVEALSHAELRADVSASYDNPFDPEQISVEARVALPDGREVVVPGFFYAPIALETRLGAERLGLSGDPEFRVRYTPPIPGAYRLVVVATDRTGSVRSEPVSLHASRASDPGFVRVSSTSPLYFATDDGRPFFAVGENAAWANGYAPLADYERWFRGLGEAGGNWARLFLSNNEKGLEWMPPPTPRPGVGIYFGLGRYAQDNAWRLDEVVRIAAAHGIRLVFCLGTYGEFYQGGFFNEGCWVSNPYNAANGGPCATPDDFWTHETARKLYRQRLRYIVARWGYSPAVFAWELWNEVPASPAHEAWVSEMADYLKRTDPNRHLVSTTWGSPAIWRCPDVDFTMQHVYGAANVADFTPLLAEHAADALSYGKPYIPAEFGIDWQTGDERCDPTGTGLNMHNGAWASLMSGAAGTTMVWYWDSYVQPFDLYKVLTPVRRFADTVNWGGVRFRPLTGVVARGPEDTPETFTDLTIPATVEWGKTPSSDYTVGRDGSVTGGPIAVTLGSPTRGIEGELHTSLTWHLDMPRAGAVTLRLGSVSSSARLQVRVDGELVVDRPLATGEPGKGPWKSSRYLEQYSLWLSDYDEDIPVEVPAGPHTVTVANAEGDWLQVRSIAIPGYRSSRYPNVNTLGLASPELLLVWVQNRASTWVTERDGGSVAELRGLRLTVPLQGSAKWRVEWWDTFLGTVVAQDSVRSEGGALSLPVPPFTRDIAARIVRVRD